MIQSNQYVAKTRPNDKGVTVEFWDGEELVFVTTTIPHEFCILGDMIQSCLSIAVSMGFIKADTKSSPT